MKTICYVTSTRAEFGALELLLEKVNQCDEFELKIVATGMHLSNEFGYTYNEIIDSGFEIDEKIETILSSDSKAAMTKCMALTLNSFAEYFQRKMPDILLVSGDRFEMLAVCIAAYNQGIPIAHLHGGEITEGAMDDAIRHAMTKLSYWHFAATNEYRKRIIQLGENPQRVYTVGALGVENTQKIEIMDRIELEKSINFELGEKYFVVTFHPETMGSHDSNVQIHNLFKAIDCFKNYKVIITKANSDADGRKINLEIEKYALQNLDRIKFVDSLGMKRYLSAVKYCSAVIGNSSSGIVEVPSFRVPTVNIGNRQKGRICADSVIHCTCDENSIKNAINKAISFEFQDRIKNVINPYGDGETSDKILKILLRESKKELKIKSFYDVEFEI